MEPGNIRKCRLPCATTAIICTVTTFHVCFERPGGWTYEFWPSAASDLEAVAAADDLLEYVERIGIRDYLNPDGMTVRSPAHLSVQPTTDAPPSGISLRITATWPLTS